MYLNNETQAKIVWLPILKKKKKKKCKPVLKVLWCLRRLLTWANCREGSISNFCKIPVPFLCSQDILKGTYRVGDDLRDHLITGCATPVHLAGASVHYCACAGSARSLRSVRAPPPRAPRGPRPSGHTCAGAPDLGPPAVDKLRPPWPGQVPA